MSWPTILVDCDGGARPTQNSKRAFTRLYVLIVSAEKEPGARLARSVREAGFTARLLCEDEPPQGQPDAVAFDGYAPAQLDSAVRAALAILPRRPHILAGVTGEAEAIDAGIAAGIDDFYTAGSERSLLFRLQLHERLGAASTAHDPGQRIEQANDVIYTVDFEGRFTSANAAAERLTGYPRSRIIGMSMAEVLLPDYLGPVQQEIAAKLAGQKQSSFIEAQIRRADGTTRWVEITSQVLFEHGKPIAIQGIARDVSQRRERDDNILFRAEILESLDAAAFATTVDGRVVYWNSAAEAMFGLLAADVVGTSVIGAICPADSHERTAAWLAGLADGSRRRDEGLLCRADGSTFPALVASSPLRNDDGKIEAAVVVCIDLTERILQEDRLRQLAAVVDSAAIAVIVRDLEARVTSWNSEAERLLGYSASEAMGKTMRELAPNAQTARTTYRAVMRGEATEVEDTRVHKDGHEVPVRVTSFPVRDASGVITGAATLLYDLSERREREQALRETEERFRAAAELSLDAFFILSAERNDRGEIVDFRFTDMNSAGERLLTIPRDEAMGGLLCELFPASHTGGFFEKYLRVLETGETLDEEFAVDSSQIRAGWLHHTVVKLGDGIAVTSRDITQRQLQAQQLDEARANLRAIFESTSEAVVVLTPDLHVIIANSAGLETARRLFGSAPQPGEHFRPWVRDSDWERFEANCRRALEGERVSVRSRSLTIDGAAAWYDYTFQPVRDEQGVNYAVSMVARDVSEARAMEAELAEREAALTAVFQSMNEAMVLMDVERRFILGNPLARARTRRFVGKDPVAGVSMEEYVRPEHWRALRSFHRRALNGEHPTVETPLTDDDGITTWWEYSYHPVRDAHGDVSGVAMVIREITDRKAAEHALQEATRHHRDVIENTSDAIFVVDVDDRPEERIYRVAMVNSAFERLTGLRGSTVAGARVSDALPRAAALEAVRRYEEAIAAGGTITYDEIVPYKTHPHIQTTLTAVFDGDGRCYQIVGTSRDITERVRLEQEERRARESAERLALIVESANDAIISLDLERRVASWSPGAERVYGYSAEETIGRNVELIYPEQEETRREAAARLEQVYAGGTFVDSPTRRRHKDGRLVDVLVSAFPLRNSDGDIVGVGSTATDISEQRRAEEALREKAADLNAVFESSRDQLILLDPTGAIVSANAAAMEAWASAAVHDRPFGGFMRDWVPDEARADFDEKFQGALEGRPVAFERQTHFAGETQWFEVTYQPVRLEDGSVRGVVITSRNTTERNRATEALMQAQKLESLAVLAGGIAHDFNNLLVGILGNAGLALSELPAASPARPTVQAIETAGLRAAELARQMLAYSGKGQFLIQNVDISSLVEEMTHLLRVSIGKGVRLQLNLAENLPAVEADATQLRQVIMNLVVNASDAIGEGPGVVTVTTSLLDASRELLADSYLAPDLPEGRYVTVDVTDTGSGMDATTLARIFDPFFTTKFAGRGLGLAAALGIMRGHKGAIKVESQPGEGTSFRLLLPALTTGAGGSENRPSPAPWRGSGLVLVVDDEPTVRLVTARALRAFGFDVLEASDGVEGVETYREHGSDIRCVLLDMTMPRMNGEEAFFQIKSIDPEAHIILMSGYTEQDATERFSGKGLAGFIQKPYELSVLREMLRTAIEGSAPA